MMNREALVSSAARLTPPSVEAVQEYAAHVPVLAALLDDAMLAHPNLEQLVGSGNMAMMQNNHRNHFRYMASVMAVYDPASFAETVVWVVRTYRAHGFSLAYWPVMLEQALQAMQRTLRPATAAQVAPFYEWLASQLEGIAHVAAAPTAWETASPMPPVCGEAS